MKHIFSFTLYNCSVGANKLFKPLYTEWCPDGETYATVFNLEWISFTSFYINIFQIWGANHLTFECEVRAYGNDADLPESCDTRRRKQRTGDDMAPMSKNIGTFYTFIIISNLLGSFNLAYFRFFINVKVC